MEKSVNLGMIFKTQIEATRFLIERGYKVSQSAFNRDVLARKISTTAEGHFSELALLAYANAFKTPTTINQNEALTKVTKDRTEHDARLKKAQAERMEIRLAKEKGEIISRSDHERDLAARALFFKKEVENFIHLRGAPIIHLVGGDENKLQDLIEYWNDITADWLHAWSEEREFIVNEYDEED